MFAIMFEIKMYLERPEEDKNLSQSIKFFLNQFCFLAIEKTGQSSSNKKTRRVHFNQFINSVLY